MSRMSMLRSFASAPSVLAPAGQNRPAPAGATSSKLTRRLMGQREIGEPLLQQAKSGADQARQPGAPRPGESLARIGVAYGFSARELGSQARKQGQPSGEAVADAEPAQARAADNQAGRSGQSRRAPDAPSDLSGAGGRDQEPAEAPAGGQPDEGAGQDDGDDSTGLAGEELSDAEARAVRDLQRRDAEIRAHEQAHLAAAGGYARGGASYHYQTGPDGRRYAVGGEVRIDVSEASSPEETKRKMQMVRRAALAPQNPSAQDRRVSTIARTRESAARQEAARVKSELPAVEESRPAGDKEEAVAAEPAAAAAAEAPRPQAAQGSAFVQQSEPGEPPAPDAAGAPDGSVRERLHSAASRAVQAARQVFAARAYALSRKGAPATPDVRAMQPGEPRRQGGVVVTTLEPPPGSPAEVAGTIV